ncbi:MAG: hypothetical protein PHD71_02295 [Methanospirillum sp.]|nr:hypothetical protein [Methanospirillum sp.]
MTLGWRSMLTGLSWCGAVLVNDIPAFRIDGMPYGRINESEIGKKGSYFAIHEMTEERLIIIRS